MKEGCAKVEQGFEGKQYTCDNCAIYGRKEDATQHVNVMKALQAFSSGMRAGIFEDSHHISMLCKHFIEIYRRTVLFPENQSQFILHFHSWLLFI